MFVEKDERERRKNNLLIFGVNKSSEDTNEAIKQVEAIFSKIGIAPSVIAHSRRFRQNDASKPAPIFVRLSEGTDRHQVILAAKKLRTSTEFKNVFINPDRTEAERELDRQLRQKRDILNKVEEEKPNEGRPCIWYIRGDKLFKTVKKPNEGANGKPNEGAKRKPTEGANGKPKGGANSQQPGRASNC